MAEFAKLVDLLKEKLPSARGLEITNETLLRDELGLDSLRLVDVLVSIEEAFDIIFDESDLNPSALRNVGDLLNIIDKTLSA